jgi:hypothetical protein
MWTSEPPVVTGAGGLPNFVMLSPTGEVVLMGNPITMHKQIEDYLDGLKRSRTKPPADLHKALKGAYKDHSKGKLGAAIAEVKKIAATATQDKALAEACTKLLDEMNKVADTALSRLDRAIAEGAYTYARGRAKDLTKSLKGSEYEAKLAAVIGRLDDKALAPEIAAEKALAKIEKQLYSKGAAPTTKKTLERFAEKHTGTKAAAQAQLLAAAIG